MRFKHDWSREERCGVPEIIFGEGKSASDLVSIAKAVLSECGRVVITRIGEEKAAHVRKAVKAPGVVFSHNREGQVLIARKKTFKAEKLGTVAVLTAGTSDVPVAEEAAAIAEEFGCSVVREYDVGIAGIHRVFSALERAIGVDVFIVVAGMEGALPSVVAGIVSQPVIAVPSSVGYGVGAGGKAALNTMLNSCTSLAVVNIDNGFGAAIFALKILSAKK